MFEADPVRLLQPAATRVRDPVSGRSVWLAGIIQHARLEDGALKFDLSFQPPHTPTDRAAIAEAVVANLRELGLELPVEPRITDRVAAAPPRKPPAPDPVPGMSGPGMGPHGGPIVKKQIEGVKHIVAVASGKGGVGKSTVACNLAVGLALRGLAVGLLDADIYGPSLPVMMNVTSKPMVDDERRIIPPGAYGVRCISIGLLLEATEAVIWRGPMVMSMVRQFLQETRWGDLDVLVIDLPPGTGDAQLTLIQAVTLAGAVIVTTPQEVALADAVRGIQMFRKLEVPLLGVVQNMAYYQLPDGTRDYVFGQDGGRRIAEQYDTSVIAELPLRTAIRQSGDNGLPAILTQDASAEPFRALAAAVAGKLGLS